jgi:hypothetical protein
MRRLWICVGVIACLIWSATGSAFASSADHGRSSAASSPRGCKTVTYTGDGGYYSQGGFYWEPGDTVTLTTHWCYARGVITSHRVTYSTSIGSALNPRFTVSAYPGNSGWVLNVTASGDYDTGILNNVGQIDLVGRVTAKGSHHFANESGAGG